VERLEWGPIALIDLITSIDLKGHGFSRAESDVEDPALAAEGNRFALLNPRYPRLKHIRLSRFL